MKHYTINGKTANELPGILRLADGSCVSPVTEETFVQMGGTITDDGQPGPKEAVIASLNTLLRTLAEQVDGISIAEFKQAASGMHSGELIAYARRKGVSEEIISGARARFIEIMADALREEMSWAELVEGIRP